MTDNLLSYSEAKIIGFIIGLIILFFILRIEHGNSSKAIYFQQLTFKFFAIKL